MWKWRLAPTAANVFWVQHGDAATAASLRRRLHELSDGDPTDVHCPRRRAVGGLVACNLSSLCAAFDAHLPALGLNGLAELLADFSVGAVQEDQMPLIGLEASGGPPHTLGATSRVQPADP
eukprot:3000237-Prymnesium_polylepis.1